MAGATTTKAVAKPARSPGASLALNSVQDLRQLAELLYKGGVTPPGIDSPAKVAGVILAGMEVGLAPTQALGSIMLTNGRHTIYGDGALGLVRGSGLLEAIAETVEGDGNARAGKCVVKRKGEPERTFTFSMAEANKAGLIERAKGKGPWASYPDRMLLMRARGFALRDVFPDVLRGLITYEEAADIVDVEVKVVGATANPAPAPAPAPVAPAVAALPAAPVMPVAAEALAPAAATSAASAPATQQADGPVTDDQKAQFLELRKLVCAAAGCMGDKDREREAWSAALTPFGVTSVGQLTSAKAVEVIAALGKQHQPF